MKHPTEAVHEYRGDATPLRNCKHNLDPVTVQIIRHALASAANQMVKTMVRTAFTPVLYEALDFAVVLYDRDFRLLAQGATIPAFTGTMGFCIQAAVENAGGDQSLLPGDVILYNVPHGTGSHAQDCAVILPVFDEAGTHIGYCANKAHWADIGAKNFYCTDTTDLFQEGTLLPGVKLYAAGVENESVRRIILANSRSPNLVAGDIKAQISSCNVGANELSRIVSRFGYATFLDCIETIIEHSERKVRAFLESLPDGVYTGTCYMDNNGVENTPITFEVTVEIAGSDIIIDYSAAPPTQRGPVNCPLPSTVSLSRILLSMIAGSYEAPNEGMFRPLTVRTKPGSMYNPHRTAPSFLYGWGIDAAMEGVLEAFAAAIPTLPAGSAGDICALDIHGVDADGKFFALGAALPVGHGANPTHDGNILYIPALANSRTQSAEIIEARNPVLVDAWEITADTAGPGKFRGGPGWQLAYRTLSNAEVISIIERTLEPARGRDGGLPGVANRLELEEPDESVEIIGKVTGKPVRKGTRLRIFCGGGGGYGAPAERDPALVLEDLRNGVVTLEHVKRHYQHALESLLTLAHFQTAGSGSGLS